MTTTTNPVEELRERIAEASKHTPGGLLDIERAAIITAVAKRHGWHPMDLARAAGKGKAK